MNISFKKRLHEFDAELNKIIKIRQTDIVTHQ